MKLKNIIQGTINNITNTNQTLSEERMDICRKCPLFNDKSGIAICNPFRTIKNIETNKMVHGCGCILESKTTVANESCPAGKWKESTFSFLENKTPDENVQ